MGNNMLSVAQKFSNTCFYRRLNTISTANDAHAIDVMYHNMYDKMYETFSKKYFNKGAERL